MDLIDDFWDRIQNEIGVVLPHIKNILRLEGLAANAALGTLSRDDIMQIQDQMRVRVHRVKQELEKNPSKTMEDYYADHSEDPEGFRFSIGDVRVLELIVRTINKDGIGKYIRNESDQTRSVPQAESQASNIHMDLLRERSVLIARLQQHLSKCVDPEIRRLTTSFERMEIKFEKGAGGKLIAHVICPACQQLNKLKELKVVKEATRSWPIFNLTRHFNTHSSTKATVPPLIEQVEAEEVACGSADEPSRKRFRQTEAPVETPEKQNEETADPLSDGATVPPLIKQVEAEEVACGSADEPSRKRFRQTEAPVETPEKQNEETADPLSDGEFEIEALDPEDLEASRNHEDYDPVEGSSRSTVVQDEHGVPRIDKSPNDSTLIRELGNMHRRLKESNPHSRKYSELEKDIASFEFLTAGNSHYEFLSSNITTMTKKTIQRHIKKYTVNITEGVLDVTGLKKYLVDNNFPLAVTLCEDGTRITAATEYDYGKDSIRGLVAPLDSDGLPIQNLFIASTPYKMAEDLKNYPVGNYAYVQVALPLHSEAAPYVLYHACSNNVFNFRDVLNRWEYTENALRREGIKVIAHASDGDSRLLKAMKNRTGLDKERIPSPWGNWFRVDARARTPINIQDMNHIINNYRNRLLRSDVKIGNYVATKNHLKELVLKYSKDNHCLSMSDIDVKDKMKFGPTLKWINPAMIKFLGENVPDSKGTVLFLNLMRMMHRSMIEDDVPLLERIHDIWTATLIVRAWINSAKLNDKNLKLCVTPNSYQSLELDAHGLILFIQECNRNNTPEQCIVSNLSSQPCEKLFRQLRSMGTTNQTVVNFSVRELTDKLKRIHMKTCIINKNKEKINFPTTMRYNDKPQTPQSLPSDEEIIAAVEKAHCTAREELLRVGLVDVDFTDAVSYKLDPPMEVEFVNCYDDPDDDSCLEEDCLTSDCTAREELVDVDFTDAVSYKLDPPMEVEFVNCYDDPDDDPCLEEDCLTSETELPKEPEFITVGDTKMDSNGSDEPIYDAEKLFPNCTDSLNLKSSTVGGKYSFKIRNLNGQVKTIKKATLLWMMSPGRFRLSNDRLRRFAQREFI